LDSTLLKQFNKIIYREKANFKKRLAVFSLFLVISAILWFLLKLSHEYSDELVYPVRYSNLQKGKIITGTPPEKISVKVKAYGYTLLRYKFTSYSYPLNIDLKELKPNQGKNSSSQFCVSTTQQFSSISTQLGKDMDVLDVFPDSICLELEDVVEKNVRVVPNLSLTFARQYMLAGNIEVEPGEITISGPAAILDTINELKTQPVSLNLLAGNKKIILNIPQVKQVFMPNSEVEVFIPVEKFTEVMLNVPIIPLNVPPSYDAILLPAEIQLRCNVTLSKYFKLKPSNFRAVCNISDTGSMEGNKLKVLLENHPDFVSRVSFEPLYVDYILKKK
jgi:hypothetical protein